MATVVPAPTAHLLPFLLGEWELARRLVDRRLGLEGRFEGAARFEADGPGTAAYREEGVLTWPGHVGPAFRSLRCTAAGSGVAFSFPDGRPFHHLELRPGGFTAEHLCGEDRYAGRFTLLGSDAFRAVWEVGGPRKGLLLDATYRRSAPASRAGAGVAGRV